MKKISLIVPILVGLARMGFSWDTNEIIIWPMLQSATNYAAIFVTTGTTAAWPLWPSVQATVPYAIATTTDNANAQGQFTIKASDVNTPPDTETEFFFYIAEASSPYSTNWQSRSSTTSVVIDKIVPSRPAQLIVK